MAPNHSVFEAVLRFSYHHENDDDDAEVLYSYQRSFFQRRAEFLSGNEDVENFFACFLLADPSHIPGSVIESLVNDSISLAHSMVTDPNNVDRKVLPIAVDIQIRSEPRTIAQATWER